MKKVMSVLLAVTAVGGIVWYEQQPTTVAIPVESTDAEYVLPDVIDDPVTTPVDTTQQPQRNQLNFDNPDVHLEVEGANGDDVTLDERLGHPKHLEDLPADVREAVMDCAGATDRDMAMQVQARLQLTSSMPATISVNYQTTSMTAVFEFDSGLTCANGRVDHDMQPNGQNLLNYWLVFRGVVTPDHPDGNFFAHSWSIGTPILTLPNFEAMTWRMWGRRVISCNTLLGTEGKVWTEGTTPVADPTDCQAVTDQARAMGNG